MTAAPAKHYVARVVISEVTAAHVVFNDTYDKVGREVPRQVNEGISSVTLSDPSLSDLLKRMAASLPNLNPKESK